MGAGCYIRQRVEVGEFTIEKQGGRPQARFRERVHPPGRIAGPRGSSLAAGPVPSARGGEVRTSVCEEEVGRCFWITRSSMSRPDVEVRAL